MVLPTVSFASSSLAPTSGGFKGWIFTGGVNKNKTGIGSSPGLKKTRVSNFKLAQGVSMYCFLVAKIVRNNSWGLWCKQRCLQEDVMRQPYELSQTARAENSMGFSTGFKSRVSKKKLVVTQNPVIFHKILKAPQLPSTPQHSPITSVRSLFRAPTNGSWFQSFARSRCTYESPGMWK